MLPSRPEANLLASYLRYLAACDTRASYAVSLRKPIPLFAPDGAEHDVATPTFSAPPESGKSELLKTLIHSYVIQPELAAIVVLDPAERVS